VEPDQHLAILLNTMRVELCGTWPDQYLTTAINAARAASNPRHLVVEVVELRLARHDEVPLLPTPVRYEGGTLSSSLNTFSFIWSIPIGTENDSAK
jgi:hypothetical protein